MEIKGQMNRMTELLYQGDERECFQSICLGGESSLEVVSLWKGILLWTNEIHLARLSYPCQMEDKEEYLFFNFCHQGRCEVELNSGAFVYMSPGVLNICHGMSWSSYYYPGNCYQGIELCLHLGRLRERMPEALSAYGIDYPLLESYSSGESRFWRASLSAMQREERLFQMVHKGKASLQEIRFEILSLSYHLLHGECIPMDCQVLVTKGQRRIVMEAEQLLMENLGRRITIEELSSLFGVSASALKKYFQAVYGRPILQYVREKRMKKAMELLAQTRESIGEIAHLCGYESQGKFGVAFKEYTGATPMEYRRLHHTRKGSPIGEFCQDAPESEVKG